MTDTNIDDIKAFVKKELVKTKEEVNRGILESVTELKNLIVIEDGTGRIIILNKDKLTNTEKIKLMMVGKYIAFLADIVTSPDSEIQTISDELGILKTTLSAPLGDMVEKNILLKKENRYRFNEVFIKEEIKKLSEKVQNG